MTVGRAKAVISYVWIAFGILLLGVVFYLTLIGKFKFAEHDWDAGLAWAIPLVLPVLGFIIPTWTLQETLKDRVVLKNPHVFVAAIALSVFYFAALIGVLMRMPEHISDIERYVNETLRTSSWVLGTFQAVVIMAVGKFFLEDIETDRAEAPPARSARKPKN